MSVLPQLRALLLEYGLEAFFRYYAVYKGAVVDNKDPDFSGRLKLKVTQVWGNDVHDYWAPSRGMPSGGKGLGMFLVPNVGDIVWVTFQNGDCRFPIWEYGPLTKGKTSPHAKTGNPNQSKAVVLQHTNGYRVVMDDVKKRMTLETTKFRIILDDAANTIRFETASGLAIEPLVLGTQFTLAMAEFLTDIGTIAGITVPGASATLPISTSPMFAPLIAKWAAKWPTVLSKKVMTE